MPNPFSPEQIARTLEEARQQHRVIAPPSVSYPQMTLSDGYRIQQAWTDLRRAKGGRTVGYKVGFTSRAMQKAYAVASPLFGRLFETDVVASGSTIDMSRYCRPQLELELAFVIGKPIASAKPTLEEVMEATAYVQPALEIIDYRTTTPRSIPDMVADNTAGAGAVLGVERTRLDAIDPARVAAVLKRNGEVEDTGVSAAVLGHPANAVMALARDLSTRAETLQPGDIILTGSFSSVVELRSGDVIEADYGMLGHIRIEVLP